MEELGYIPMRDEASQFPVEREPGESFLVVQPFPTIEVDGPFELVVPPREYGTLVERPAVREAA